MSRNPIKLNDTKTNRLDYNWCILDKDGVEKVVFENTLNFAYIVKNSQMFFYNGGVWNIETNTLISKYDGSTMESDDYLFLNNLYDKDVTRRGVWKICKRTCSVELFSLTNKN